MGGLGAGTTWAPIFLAPNPSSLAPMKPPNEPEITNSHRSTEHRMNAHDPQPAARDRGARTDLLLPAPARGRLLTAVTRFDSSTCK